MCSVAALALTSIAFAAAGTGVAAVSSSRQATSANEAAKYNADLLEVQAQDAESRGQTESLQHRQRVSQLVGKQRSVLAASGVEVGEGSAAAIVSETQVLGNLDAMQIKHNAKQEARDLRAGAALQRSRVINPNLGAAGSILSGGSRLGGQILQYNYIGAFN